MKGFTFPVAPKRLRLSGFLVATMLLPLAAPPALAGVNRWTSSGPDGVDATTVVIDPSSPSTIYVGTRTGVLRSINGGETWADASSGLAGLYVGRLVIAPSAPSTLYAQAYALVGGGKIFKSTNGGSDWRPLTPPADNVAACLAVDPTTSSTVYLGTYGSGVFKSTDGGETWLSASAGLTLPAAVLALAIDPSNPAILFAGSSQGGNPPSGGLFKSADGSRNWTLAALPTGYTLSPTYSLAIDPSRSSTVYAANETGIIKSIDGGTTWTPINTGESQLFSGAYALALVAAAPETVYVATYSGLLKSTNGGASWVHIKTGPAGQELLYVGSLAIARSAPQTLFATGRGGIIRSTDGGDTWAAANRGLKAAAVFALALDPSTASTVYAGTDGGVFKSTNAGSNWSGAAPGLRSPSATALLIDPSTPSTIYAGGKGVFKSLDGGETWDALGLLGTRITTLAIDPVIPANVYAGTENYALYKSTNGGANWNQTLAAAVYALVFKPRQPSEPSEMWAADYEYPGLPGLFIGSTLFKSFDGGSTWRQSGVISTSSVSAGALVIDPTRPYIAYAGTEGSLYKSVDAGVTWTGLSTSMYGVTAIAFDPRNPDTLYAATRFQGVFRSPDGGESWTPFNAGLTNLSATSLAIDPSGTVLHVGTSGGVFDFQISRAPCVPGMESLCLLSNRFQVNLNASDRRTGRTGIGQAIPQGDRFGYFSLPSFTGDAAFPEVFVKMADATSLPGGSFWVFYSGLTDLQYTMTVIDTVTGEVKSYRNDPANPTCGGADTSAFKNIGASGQQLTVGNAGPATSLAAASGTELALLGNRFRVTLSAVDPRTGNTGVGQAMPQGDRFGYFSLPDFTGDPAFPEVFVKMADATSSSGGFWVFHTGLTDVQYTMTVTDTVTGAVKTYQNDRSNPARLCGGSDTAAFSN